MVRIWQKGVMAKRSGTGNPPPTWSEQAGSVFITFTPAFGETTP
jgi:hypothetical protein